MVVSLLSHVGNRQDTEIAKKSVMTPRKDLGGFEKNLAPFASLAV
jgi:hypothetical protein